MNEPEDGFPQARTDRKTPWVRPTVKLAGTVSLLVRAGSAIGKAGGNVDGDASQFQTCNPSVHPNCPS